MKHKYTFSKSQEAFTLIELLVVIGILAVLLAITLVAINPAKQFSAANNTKRQSDVNSILNALNQYQADNHGGLPTNLSAANCPAATPCGIKGGGASGTIDVCPSLVTKYLAALPVDPLVNNGAAVSTCNSTYDTGYQVSVSTSDARITLYAPRAESGATISVTR